MAKPHLARDGFQARESGPWAQEKLHYLRRYFYIFNQGMKYKWPHRIYVDVLAGPGRCYLKDRPTEEFDGSPILALKCETPFTDAIFIEHDSRNVEALAFRAGAIEYPDTKVTIYEENCNSPSVISEVNAALRGHGKLGLMFVDTLGLSDIALETVRRMTIGAKVDVLFTFQVHDALRNLGRALDDEEEGARYTRAFSSPNWCDVLPAHRTGYTATADDADAFSAFFESRLREIGFSHVKPLDEYMRNSHNTPLYRLIFASRNPCGEDFFKKIATVNLHGAQQLPMFE